jgi:P-type Ca2+ transporter type 2B
MCVLIKKNENISSRNEDIQQDYNFDIDNEMLGDLMKLNGIECVEKIRDQYEGVNGLADRLHSNFLNGLSEDEKDIKKRVEKFGRNEIPPKPPKTFIEVYFKKKLFYVEN